jgi:hypothetical protein
MIEQTLQKLRKNQITVSLSWWLIADKPPPAVKNGMLTAQKPTTVAISAEIKI